MKDFLKKYLDEMQLQEIEQKYITDHPDAKGLPIFITKARLDEVIGQKKSAEESTKKVTEEFETFKHSVNTSIEEAVKKAKEEFEDTKVKMQKDFATTEAIYKAKGRNVKAVKALIDTEKDIEAEIKRLQKDEPYLFGDSIPTGTGKNEPSSDNNANKDKIDAQMRQAVGLY